MTPEYERALRQYEYHSQRMTLHDEEADTWRKSARMFRQLGDIHRAELCDERAKVAEQKSAFHLGAALAAEAEMKPDA